jgi:hypothetical protein
MDSRASEPYGFFDVNTAATFGAAAECIIPAEPGLPGGGAERVLRVADRMLARRPAADRKKLAVFLRVLEQLPRLRYGRRFSALSAQQRARVLAFLAGASVPLLRVGLFGLKTYVLMGYYGSESAWAELEYPGPRTDAPAAIASRRAPP